MKSGIHPQYQEATVICACGNTFTTGSTRKVLRTDLCYKCHPFYTGEQRIVDSAGQVDRFVKRLGLRQEQPKDKKKRKKRQIIELVSPLEEMAAQASGEDKGAEE
jgi:large subunit ribosomal protein L31